MFVEEKNVTVANRIIREMIEDSPIMYYDFIHIEYPANHNDNRYQIAFFDDRNHAHFLYNVDQKTAKIFYTVMSEHAAYNEYSEFERVIFSPIN